MRIELYHESGYLNVPALMNTPYSIVICVGGRGIGKTFGGLDYCYTHYKGKFIYMRRTPKVVKMMSTYCPFTQLNIKKGYNVVAKRNVEDTALFYDADKDGKPAGAPVGMMASLETFSDVRSAGLEHYKFIFYDEFIPEPHRRKIKGEGFALLNMVETINRNRELDGESALKLFMASNSDNIFAPVLYDLKLTDALIKMQKERKSYIEIPERHLLLLNCRNNPISAAKKSTVFYEFAGDDSEFSQVAAGNVFVNLPPCIKSEDVKQYNVMYKLGELYIYLHKFDNKYFVTNYCKHPPKEIYESTDRGVAMFKRAHIEIIAAFYNDLILFEKVSHYTRFTDLLTLAQ